MNDIFTIFALICWFPGTQKPIFEIQVTSKINGGGLTPPIIYLDTWISNIDFLYTGNQRINANMVNELRCIGFPTRSNTNGAVQPQKMARGLKFGVKK